MYVECADVVSSEAHASFGEAFNNVSVKTNIIHMLGRNWMMRMIGYS